MSTLNSPDIILILSVLVTILGGVVELIPEKTNYKFPRKKIGFSLVIIGAVSMVVAHMINVKEVNTIRENINIQKDTIDKTAKEISATKEATEAIANMVSWKTFDLAEPLNIYCSYKVVIEDEQTGESHYGDRFFRSILVKEIKPENTVDKAQLRINFDANHPSLPIMLIDGQAKLIGIDLQGKEVPRVDSIYYRCPSFESA